MNTDLNTLESILNGMDAYIYVTDPETDVILFINDKMREHFDFDENLSDDVKCWAVLQTGMTKRCPFCPVNKLIDNPNQTVVWEEQNTVTNRDYRNSDKFIKWSDGRLVHMQHSVDITEMKEESVIQQELMSRISQSFISGNDLDKTIEDVEKMICETMGYKRVFFSLHLEQTGELLVSHQWTRGEDGLGCIGQSIPFKKGEDFYDRITKNYKPVISRKTSSSENHFGLNELGITTYIASPICLNGKMIGVVEFDIDVEKYVWEINEFHLIEFLCGIAAGVFDNREKALRLTQVYTLVENVMHPIFYIDTNENITYFNSAAYNTFGYTEQELLDGGLELLFGAETFNLVRQEVWPRAFEDGIIEIDLPLIHKNGDVRILSFLGVVIHEKGELSQLATIGTDITDLVDAKETAEAVSNAKTEFLARMSHEIRTPMNAIIGMTSIAQESDDPERKEYCLEKISSASRHLLGVINDILDMSKIEANKFEINAEEFDFEKMLMNITNMVGFRIEEKEQVFIVNFDHNISHSIISDEQRLSQVIVNLLSNAVKFTPEYGTISLTVKCLQESEREMTLRFSVSDTGIGISPEQQSKLFTSFEQADGSISRRFGGTGLGLSISKRIIELMDGTIGIDSEIGKGTEVTFDVVVGKGSKNETSVISSLIDRKNLRILAVDDSNTTREYFTHLMVKLKLSCDVVTSGAEALEMIDKAYQIDKPYNFFFIDWLMPDMDGLELSKKIKERVASSTVIIMSSSAKLSESEGEAIDIGVDAMISKPLFPSALVDCINGILGNSNDAQPEDNAESSIHDFSAYTLLLVEDVEINREIVLTMLEETNIKIDIAVNGSESVEKFNANGEKYDIVFMDIHMPVMDGYEATEKIRSSNVANASSLPIIAMTANAFKEDVDRCLACGMNDHISKPVDRAVMIEKMASWLQSR